MKIIRVPAADQGGREGKVLRMKANRDLNNFIDMHDRVRMRYDVKATVETNGPDKNPADNSKTKSFNISYRVEPSFLNVYNYVYRNYTDKALKVHWVFEHTPYPDGWEIKGVPNNPKSFDLKAGQEIRGSLTMAARSKIAEDAFVEAR